MNNKSDHKDFNPQFKCESSLAFLARSLFIRTSYRSALETLQKKRLKRLLCYAAEFVPYYQDLFMQSNLVFNEEMSEEEIFESFLLIPFTEKSHFIRVPVRQRVSKQFSLEELYSESTSGSSGQKLRIYLSRKDRKIRDFIRFRSFWFSGYNPFTKIMYFASRAKKPKTKSFFKKHLFFRNGIIDISNSPTAGLQQLREYKPSCLFSYPGYVSEMARINDKLDTPFQLDLIILAGEMVDMSTMNMIGQSFNAKILQHYGARELGRLAFQDGKDGSFQLNEDCYIFETNEDGELLVTSLMQFAMPLIRYNLNDKLELADSVNGSCFRTVRSILGRNDDYLIDHQGQKVSHYYINSMMRKAKGVIQFQIRQEFTGKATLNLVVDTFFNKPAFQKQLSSWFPGITFSTEILNEIPRQGSGKHKAVISLVRNTIY